MEAISSSRVVSPIAICRSRPASPGISRRRCSTRNPFADGSAASSAAEASSICPFGSISRTVASRFKKRAPALVSIGEDDVDSSFQATTREPDPLELYEFSERLARLQDAVISELTDEQRQLFELHHLENRSIQEIAGLLQKSEDAVKSHLYRARKVLLAR